jgi:hypothetical protein
MTTESPFKFKLLARPLACIFEFGSDYRLHGQNSKVGVMSGLATTRPEL